MNLISLPETKNYLRVDHCEDDKLILTLIDTAQRLVMDVGRMKEKQLAANVRKFLNLKDIKLQLLMLSAEYLQILQILLGTQSKLKLNVQKKLHQLLLLIFMRKLRPKKFVLEDTVLNQVVPRFSELIHMFRQLMKVLLVTKPDILRMQDFAVHQMVLQGWITIHHSPDF